MFKRKIFSHISDAVNAHHSGKRADLIVNCTGLSAGKLGGVEDKNMVPVRGQTVLVRNECGFGCGINDRAENVCYVMQRPAGKNRATHSLLAIKKVFVLTQKILFFQEAAPC